MNKLVNSAKSHASDVAGLMRREMGDERRAYRMILRRSSIALEHGSKYHTTGYWPLGMGLTDAQKREVRMVASRLGSAVGFAESIGLGGLNLRKTQLLVVEGKEGECKVEQYDGDLIFIVSRYGTDVSRAAMGLFYALGLDAGWKKWSGLSEIEKAQITSGAYLFSAAFSNAGSVKGGRITEDGIGQMCSALGIEFERINRKYNALRGLRNANGVRTQRHNVTEIAKLVGVENELEFMLEARGRNADRSYREFAVLSLLAADGDVASLARMYLESTPNDIYRSVAKRILSHA